MPSPRYRVCLPLPLAECVEEMAEATGQSRSGVIRRCIELALSSPELQVLLRAEGPAPLTDTRTQEQIEAWERYQQQGFGPAFLVNENHDHLPY